MLEGRIQSLSTDKGFGFIQPSTGGPDLFFHCSSVDAEFDSLTIGQQVKYEPDESAAKPRAKSVVTGTATPRKERPRNRERSSPDTNQRPQVVEVYDFGFVTKLRRRKSAGYISSIQGGPEYLFDAASVVGKKAYYDLDVGDYVRFVPQKNDDDPKQPLARSVMSVQLVASGQDNKSTRHPRSRGKKPTWR
jgi:CspA family cold shock protein